MKCWFYFGSRCRIITGL